MRQLIKNIVYNRAHSMGLPLHRISFARTGERSTPACELSQNTFCSFNDASRPDSFRRTDYAPNLENNPFDLRPG